MTSSTWATRQRGLIVGDCVGHGLEAATVMAQLRSAARAMILEGRDPAAVLDGLDTFASSIEGAACATVVCAVFDRNKRTLTYARAGHPPPLIVNAAGVTWLDQAGGPPLSIDTGRPRANAVVDVDDADVLVLYSDGLIERRGESLDIGLDRLAVAATELYGAHRPPHRRRSHPSAQSGDDPRRCRDRREAARQHDSQPGFS